VYFLWQWTWGDRNTGMEVCLGITLWFIAPLAGYAFACIALALALVCEAPIPPNVQKNIKEALISSRSRRDGVASEAPKPEELASSLQAQQAAKPLERRFFQDQWEGNDEGSQIR